MSPHRLTTTFVAVCIAAMAACQNNSTHPQTDTLLDLVCDGCLVRPDTPGSEEVDAQGVPDATTKDSPDLLPPDLNDALYVDSRLDSRNDLDLADQSLLDTLLDTHSDGELSDLDELEDLEDLDAQDAQDIPVGPPPLFDLPKIMDSSTAACTFEAPHTVLKDGLLLDVWHVHYYSFEAANGQLVPILIQGYAAKPAGQNGPMPGIIQAHGLGGFADESHATGVAALTGMFVLAYTGPGGGSEPDNTSQGPPSSAENGYHMFDVLEDPRSTWFWGHAVAAMRGITCLTTRSEVDASRIGMTGFSAGGVATFLVAGADPRLKAGVPLSGTLAWDVAIQSPKAWQNNLLALANLTPQSPEWSKLLELLISPQAMLAATSAKLFLVNGTTDEFFPLTAHMATLAVLPAAQRRTSLAANFDHGCYQISGLEDPGTIEERANLRATGAQRAWFRHHFATDPNYQYFPMAPTLQTTAVAGATYFSALVDTGGPSLQVERAEVWWSGDNCFSFLSQELEDQGNGLYGVLVPAALTPNSVYYVDVLYKTSGLFPQRFSLSSDPVLPQGLIPHIRDMGNCL